MQDSLNYKKQGDSAFRAKDFNMAIDCYTQVLTLSYYYTRYYLSKCMLHNEESVSHCNLTSLNFECCCMCRGLVKLADIKKNDCTIKDQLEVVAIHSACVLDHYKFIRTRTNCM